MNQTRDQQRFTISEVAADWHEPMVPQRIMWPSKIWGEIVVLANKKKVKERIVLREIHLRTTRRHLSNGITQCYMLPDKSGRPAFTPTGQVATRFIDLVRMKV